MRSEGSAAGRMRRSSAAAAAAAAQRPTRINAAEPPNKGSQAAKLSSATATAEAGATSAAIALSISHSLESPPQHEHRLTLQRHTNNLEHKVTAKLMK